MAREEVGTEREVSKQKSCCHKAKNAPAQWGPGTWRFVRDCADATCPLGKTFREGNDAGELGSSPIPPVHLRAQSLRLPQSSSGSREGMRGRGSHESQLRGGKRQSDPLSSISEPS